MHTSSRLWSNKLDSNKISFDCPVTGAIFHVFIANRECKCLFQGHYILYAHTALTSIYGYLKSHLNITTIFEGRTQAITRDYIIL